MSTSLTKKHLSQPARKDLAADPQILREIGELCGELAAAVQTSVDRALRIGLRLLIIYRDSHGEEGGFRAALECVEGFRVPRSTAYRWINAAGRFLARHQQITDESGNFLEEDLLLPKPGTREFTEVETAIRKYAATSSMRRLMLGSAATSEESRYDTLISASEEGDQLADEILDKIAAGQLTLVQAIRAKAGSAATKGKERRDPCYLDIDGQTGEAKGLFVRSLITLSNTFDHWSELDETARSKAKSAWKALVTKLPSELR